jgi:hypothetical protein
MQTPQVTVPASIANRWESRTLHAAAARSSLLSSRMNKPRFGSKSAAALGSSAD